MCQDHYIHAAFRNTLMLVTNYRHFFFCIVLWSSAGAGPAGAAMSSLSRELVFLILQFLDEEKFKESVHK